jgi:hypothetical protein
MKSPLGSVVKGMVLMGTGRDEKVVVAVVSVAIVLDVLSLVRCARVMFEGPWLARNRGFYNVPISPRD